ncbi:hypothetical protein EYZ11_008603 [Aspergillus tanneri]|uniref:Uncharacterized protein n=1 Tax=Aspergillus tanneri TaxID=1220188 RepID=A0A4S3JCA2_9EURO|nr:hypothetical protein EYZ11_008603 [Aspergillus tanneri]
MNHAVMRQSTSQSQKTNMVHFKFCGERGEDRQVAEKVAVVRDDDVALPFEER